MVRHPPDRVNPLGRARLGNHPLGLLIVFKLQGTSAVDTAENTLSPTGDILLGLFLVVVAVLEKRDQGSSAKREKKKADEPEKTPLLNRDGQRILSSSSWPWASRSLPAVWWSCSPESRAQVLSYVHPFRVVRRQRFRGSMDGAWLSNTEESDMSDDPVFVYAAVYADRADADADYDTLLDLHSAELVGSYDVALMYKDDEGKVHVTKHEKPTQHGAWTGAAVGALVGIIFPPSIIGAAVVGAAAGGGIGHALGGMSRSDAKELGEQLGDGQAALVVIGKSRVDEQLDKALTRAQKSEEREIDADAKELEKELDKLPKLGREKPVMPAAAHQGRRARTLASPEERAAAGKAARDEVPRSSHAEWEPPATPQDPVDVSLEEQAKTRVPELVPIRHGRMLASPFTFYRGAAAIMAMDLAETPQSGLRVQACGDAHLSNFGDLRGPRPPPRVRRQRLRRDASRARGSGM